MYKRLCLICKRSFARSVSASSGKHRGLFKAEKYEPKKVEHRKVQKELKLETPKTQAKPSLLRARIDKEGKIEVITRDKFEKSLSSSELLEALRVSSPFNSLKSFAPTLIQKRSVPTIISSQKLSAPRSYLIAAETGSGKTLGYLLPIIHILKAEEDVNPDFSKSTRCLTLVPTAELVNQVLATVKGLGHIIKLSSAKCDENFLIKRASRDILVSTPHIFLKNINRFKDVKHVVVDEADTLLEGRVEKSFRNEVEKILKGLKRLENCIICSATYTKSLQSYCKENFPGLAQITTSRLHSLPRKILVNVVNVQKNHNSNKLLACANALNDILDGDKSVTENIKIIIFVNETDTITKVKDYLEQRKGFEHITAFTKDTSDRAKTIERFCNNIVNPYDILITTDFGSRGIDTMNVRNVILFDIPSKAANFIHRLGRTGRAGTRGYAYILAKDHNEVALVQKLKKNSINGLAVI